MGKNKKATSTNKSSIKCGSGTITTGWIKWWNLEWYYNEQKDETEDETKWKQKLTVRMKERLKEKKNMKKTKWIIDSLLKKYKARAFSLLRYILRNYNMKWEPNGTFKYKI